MSGWDLSDAIAMCTATPRDGRLANSTFDRTAGSHSLAAAGQRERWPPEGRHMTVETGFAAPDEGRSGGYWKPLSASCPKSLTLRSPKARTLKRGHAR